MKMVLKRLFENRTLNLSLIFSLILLVNAVPAFADPTIVTGAKKLFTDITLWLLGLIPVTAILVFSFQAWMKSLNEGDGGAQAERTKKMKNVIIYSAVALGGDAIVSLLLSYFK